MEDHQNMCKKQGRPAAVYETSGCFVCRIDNATTSDWKRKDSTTHSIGGVRWSLRAQRSLLKSTEYLHLYVNCGEDMRNSAWSCSAKYTIALLPANDTHQETARHYEYKFCNGKNSWGTECFAKWKDVEDGCLVNDTMTIRVDVEIVECSGIIRKLLSTFDSPLFSDVTLIVEDKKIYVGKQVLAMHCTFFATLFFGKFDESGKSEVRLNEVVHDEFIDFLKVLYPERKEVDAKNVRHLLKLADCFGCEIVLSLCAQYLLKTDQIDVAAKLYFADKYRLDALLEECLCGLKTFNAVQALAKSPDFANYSEPLLRTLIQRAPAKCARCEE